MEDNQEDELLFELRESNLNSGMRGIPVGTCFTSYVTPEGGVHYIGYPIEELAEMRPEDVVYLLHHKALPSSEESAAFRHNLAQRAIIPNGLMDVLRSLPKNGHPMDWLSVGLHTLGMLGKTGDWEEDSLNLIARMPILMALMFRVREGREDDIPDSRPELGLVENFVHVLDLTEVDSNKMIKVLKVFLVLHMDHGGGNLSTFIGKGTASGHADLYSSMASAMNALSGPLHGRANQACLDFVKRIGSPEREHVERFVRNELEEKRPIYGFGHAVLRVEDPRARIQFLLGEQICPDDLNFKIIRTLRIIAPEILEENPRINNPNANVDIASGTLLNNVGFTNSDYYTTFFGWARTAGIGAQIIDERVKMRSGKGVPIYRPKYIPKNQPERHMQ